MEKTPIWLEHARAWEGVEATPGAVATPAIIGLYAACGYPQIKTDETPWCAAFVGGSLASCGLPNTGSLAAASYAEFGVPLEGPKVGAIAVLNHHVAFVDEVGPDHIVALGGNQGHSQGKSAVTKARYKKSSVLAYRWPVPIVSAADLDASGSRTAAKGRTDILTGWVATATGGVVAAQAKDPEVVAAAAAAVNPAQIESTLGLLEKGMKFSEAAVKIATTNLPATALVAFGTYLILSGHLLRWFRVQDANTGHNVAAPAAPKAKGEKP
jgi:uncharacterized protein (TIGR02594 family)